ncbi:hypothetical protein [Tepidanaerobacter acetatoxydans]|uniref:hypothetical protein n=1 Tax=Tepidanaerobacter acetatoxydans TaxID=499229 RepID=UPI001BD4ABAC|nr:hypothetical protein [Tepidanaerobacter acetatoxydans]
MLNLANLKVSDVVIKPTHAKATVKNVALDTSVTPATLTFDVEAEDGTPVSYTINISVINPPTATTTTATFTISSPADVILNFTLNEGVKVTGVKLGNVTLRSAEYTVDTSTPPTNVTIKEAAIRDYVSANGLVAGNEIKAVVTFQVGGSIEYTITLQ